MLQYVSKQAMELYITGAQTKQHRIHGVVK